MHFTIKLTVVVLLSRSIYKIQYVPYYYQPLYHKALTKLNSISSYHIWLSMLQVNNKYKRVQQHYTVQVFIPLFTNFTEATTHKKMDKT